MRAFIYIDEYKMQSVYAQLFGGLVESFVQRNWSERENAERQKGPITSGHLLQDTQMAGMHTEERRVLYDYAYSQMEQRLMEEGKVLSVGPETSLRASSTSDFLSLSFIKIVGRAEIVDVKAIRKLLEEFNDFGEALAYVTTHATRTEQEEKTEAEIQRQGDRNRKAVARAMLKSAIDPKAIAKKNGLSFDKRYLDYLAKLLERGLEDSFEVSIIPSGSPRVFLSQLSRRYLREPEGLLIRKYTRRTQMELTVFGVVTQVGGVSGEEDAVEEPSSQTIRSALKQMVEGMAGIEENFVALPENGVMIDPIAVYRNLR